MWLRRIRAFAASVCFLLITLLFLDFTGALHLWFGWLARIQFLPALLALNAGFVLAVVGLTLVFGRVYCSVLCPLGVCQDAISWVRGRRKKNRFSYTPAHSRLRYGVLALVGVAFLSGAGTLVALLDPYSAYGRIASSLLAPAWQMGNNALAYLAERAGSYAFYSVEVWMKNGAVLAIAAVTLGIIAFLSWRNGRVYCNAICPVGTVLGLFAKASLLKPVFIPEKCTRCGLCARNCKASCIDHKTHTIDYSRCVTCLDCVAKCRQGALVYGRRRAATPPAPASEKPSARKLDRGGSSRRHFLSMAALLAASSTLKARESRVDGGLAVIKGKKIPNRQTALTPPGSRSAQNLARHCTACQLCVSACPNQVLRPSGSLATLMRPEMSYERGYCRPECTECSSVCPTGAILPVTRAEKSAIQIGHAVWIKDNCLAATGDVKCDNCVRHCPVGAIQMVSAQAAGADSPKIPVIDIERCIGCGACENLCPARPFSAIYVEGHERHRIV